MKFETVYKCCKCNSGRYWSRDCQCKQFNGHKKYCRYMSELESLEQEKLKHYSKDDSLTDNETLPTKLRNKLVNIVGKKPLINCCLNNVKFKGLWDTGSMVSLLGKKWLREMLCGVSILSLEQFMGVSDLNLRTANNNSLSIESVALIDFALKPNTEKIKVPLLITSKSMEDSIFGCNLIEHLVRSTNDPKLFDTLMSAFPHIPSEGSETVPSIIKKVAEVPDLHRDVKVIKQTIILSNSIVK